jgi:hypothetical protein
MWIPPNRDNSTFMRDYLGKERNMPLPVDRDIVP